MKATGPGHVDQIVINNDNFGPIAWSQSFEASKSVITIDNIPFHTDVKEWYALGFVCDTLHMKGTTINKFG